MRACTRVLICACLSLPTGEGECCARVFACACIRRSAAEGGFCALVIMCSCVLACVRLLRKECFPRVYSCVLVCFCAFVLGSSVDAHIIS